MTERRAFGMHTIIGETELRWVAIGIVAAMIAGYLLGYFL